MLERSCIVKRFLVLCHIVLFTVKRPSFTTRQAGSNQAMTEQVPSPGDFIRQELEKREWTQADLASILGRPLPTINRILNGKHAILPDMAIALGMAFGTGPEIWSQREAAYRLSLADPVDDMIAKRARLHALAPIKEMERRQWIQPSASIEDLERELRRFFGVESFDDDPRIGAATRRSGDQEDLAPSQRAWCFRVRQLAKAHLVAEFKDSRLPQCQSELRKLAAYPVEASKVAKVLANYGIRFVVVEPLAGCKVDGVAMWLDSDSPVIGLSLRYDRFDSFWFTLCHEFSHIRHCDEAPVDSDVNGAMMMPTEMKSEMERRADREAAAMLIPPDEIDSFIKRVGPLYSKDKIVRFAHRIKIHPGVIVGQLQHRGEIGYHANREMLSKVRHFITPAAITDGWGSTIDPRVLQ